MTIFNKTFFENGFLHRLPLPPMQEKTLYAITKLGNFLIFVNKNCESNCKKYIARLLDDS
jgi:hypothetical protein